MKQPRDIGRNWSFLIKHAGIALLAFASANAQTVNSWKASVLSDWSDSNNWSLVAIPASDQWCYVTNSKPATAHTVISSIGLTNFPASQTVSNLTISALSAAQTNRLVHNYGAFNWRIRNNWRIDNGGVVSNLGSRAIVDGIAGGALEIDGEYKQLSGLALAELFTTNAPVRIGNASSGSATFESGRWVATNVYIAANAGTRGTLTMAGANVTNIIVNSFNLGEHSTATGTVWLLNGTIIRTNAAGSTEIGRLGSGQFTMSNGIFRSSATTVGGLAGAQGTLTIAGGQYGGTGLLTLGDNNGATGTVWLTSGLMFMAFSPQSIGLNGSGEITVSNSEMDVGLATLGQNLTGRGTLTVVGGSYVVAVTNLQVGLAGSGTIWIKNGGQLVMTNNGPIVIGGMGANAGFGRLTSSNGLVFGQAITVGESTNSQGILTLDGGTNLFKGALMIGNFANATGTVSVTGGRFSATNAATTVGNAGVGALMLGGNSGALSNVVVGNLPGSAGTFTVASGTNTIKASLSAGVSSNTTGHIWMTGGELTMTNTSQKISIGLAGNGALTQSNGLLRAYNCSVGVGGGSGAMTLAGGTNHLASAGSLSIGNGTVWITGGLLTNASTTIADASLQPKDNLVVATGAVAAIQSAVVGQGTLKIAGGEYRGSLTLGLAGNVLMTDGTLDAGDTGAIAIGAGRFTQSNGTARVFLETVGSSQAFLGIRGLAIAGGLHTVGGSLTAGRDAGQTGSVWVTGGSLLVTNLNIGYRGNGTLVQSNGIIGVSVLRVGNDDFGNVSQTGTLSFFGGTASVYSNLIVGDICIVEATGVVVVAGGTLAVTNAAGNALLEVQTGTLNVSAGTLRADKIILSNSCAFLSYTGGSIICPNIVLAPGDNDGDGMSNAWENQYGFNPLDPADAAQDADGDGLTNLQEYTGGTNPRVHQNINSWIAFTHNWRFGGNWVHNFPPNSNQSVFVTNAFQNVVTIDASTTNTPAVMTISNLTVSATAVAPVTTTLQLTNAGTLTPLRILNNFSIDSGASVIVTNSRLIVEGPMLDVNAVTLNAGLTVRDGSTVAAVGLRIGGSLTKTGSLVVVGGQLVITNTPATVGAGSGWVIDGSVIVTNGSSVIVSNVSTVVGSVGSGSLTMAGGSLSASNFVVGNLAGASGTATFAGGITALSGILNIGFLADSTGTVWMTGGQLTVTNSSCNTIIGNLGIGQLTVSNGTLLHRQILMGANGGQGTLTIAGGTNTLSGTLSIANFSFTKSSVWLKGGRLVVTNAVTTIGNGGAGELTISNGSWLASNVVLGGALNGEGTLTVIGGTNSVYTGMTVGQFSCAFTSRVVVAGGSLFITNSAGNAQLDIRYGTVQLNSGTLSVNRLILSNACGHFIKSGGTLLVGSLFIDANLDADGDSIPNGFDLDPFNPADAGADPDGDGLTNLQEYQAGTNPTNSASAFQITSITPVTNSLRVTWTTGSNKTNALERTAGVAGSFATNAFTAIFTVTNTAAGTTNYLDIGAATNVPAFYYRVRLVP